MESVVIKEPCYFIFTKVFTQTANNQSSFLDRVTSRTTTKLVNIV